MNELGVDIECDRTGQAQEEEEEEGNRGQCPGQERSDWEDRYINLSPVWLRHRDCHELNSSALSPS